MNLVLTTPPTYSGCWESPAQVPFQMQPRYLPGMPAPPLSTQTPPSESLPLAFPPLELLKDCTYRVFKAPLLGCNSVISLLLSSLHQSNLEVALLRLNLVLLIWLDLVYCMVEETHYCGFQNTYHRLLHSRT